MSVGEQLAVDKFFWPKKFWPMRGACFSGRQKNFGQCAGRASPGVKKILANARVIFRPPLPSGSRADGGGRPPGERVSQARTAAGGGHQALDHPGFSNWVE